MKKKRILLVLLIILTLFNSPIFAQGTNTISSWKLILKFIFYLIIFIAVIFMALYGTKLIAKNTQGMGNSKYVKLLDTINIPGGWKITIVEINNMIYILSSNTNGTSVIDKIEGDDFLIIEEDFETYLDKYLKKNNFNLLKISEDVKSCFNKWKIIKGKEEKKDEK